MPATEIISCPGASGGVFQVESFPASGVDSAGAAALVLVHGLEGPGRSSQDAAMAFSDRGFRVLAPDLSSCSWAAGLFGGEGGDWEAEARVSDRALVAELQALLALLAQGEAPPRAVGLVGLGVGGSMALLAACQSRGVDAVACLGARLVYPELDALKPVQPLDMTLNLSAPLLAVSGELDRAVPAEHIEAARERLGAFARDAEFLILPGAGPGFFQMSSTGYDRTSAQAAWDRITAFLEAVL